MRQRAMNFLPSLRLLSFSIALSLVSGLLSGCSVDANKAPVKIPLVVRVSEIPANLNTSLIAGSSSVAKQVDSLLLPSAFYLNSTNNYILDTSYILSAEVVSVSPQVVVYNFNPRAVWSDGHPLSALDFIYTWEAQKAGIRGITLPYMSALSEPHRYDDVASVVSSANGNSVTVTFTKPLSSWRSLFNPIFPARYFQDVGFVASMSLGSDAFPTISSMSLTTYNSNEIVVKAASKSTSSFSQVDFVTPDAPGRNSRIYPTVELTSDPASTAVAPVYVRSGSTVELYFNTSDTSTALRNGVAYSIDRRAIWDKIYGATTLQTSTYTPPGNNLYTAGQYGYQDNQGYFVTQDLGKAERSFIQADLSFSPTGVLEPLSGFQKFSIAYPRSSIITSKIAPMIATTLNHSGLAVALLPYSGPISNALALSPNAILANISNSGNPGLGSSFFTAPNGFSKVGNSAQVSVANLLTFAEGQVYPLNSAKYFNEIDHLIWDHMAGLPILSPIKQITFSGTFTSLQLKEAMAICTAGGVQSVEAIPLS